MDVSEIVEASTNCLALATSSSLFVLGAHWVSYNSSKDLVQDFDHRHIGDPPAGLNTKAAMSSIVYYRKVRGTVLYTIINDAKYYLRGVRHLISTSATWYHITPLGTAPYPYD
ncbi:hypothetical protein KIN20_001037 [Parelaphostrongylus tenuis]|uniref:Uncharacterized protein n=1 Tax=Parelaphostrongylus tenuis TaxID=148309 RepID=A0AAD5MC11_PARTN|nr:hypothetical protein KIN20_001037 [Parelaphostrongylus tenuis]